MGVDIPEITIKRPSVDDARERWLTQEERERFIAACPDSIRDLVVFLFFTGARLGEAMGLEWKDVSEEGVTLRSRKTRGGRVKKRTVPMTPRVRRAIDNMGAIHGRGGVVFRMPEGRTWNRHLFYPRWRRAYREAGIEDFRPHDCRHTFASLLIQSGVRERLVADLLGHSTLNLVSRYAHLAPSHLRDAVSLLDSAPDRTGS